MSNKIRSIKRAQEQAQAREAELTVTLSDLMESQPALQALAQQPLPGEQAFRLLDIIEEVSKALKTCDNTRLKLCEQYGTKDQAGNYRFTKAKELDINREFAAVLQTRVVVKGYRINLRRINAELVRRGMSDLTISAAHVSVLRRWLTE